MELSSSDRQHLQHLIERLRMTTTSLSKSDYYGDRTLNMMKTDINFVAEELEDLIDESWHLRDDDEVPTSMLKPLLWERQPTVQPEPECEEHDKAYAGWILPTNPPKTQWICRKCKRQGTDEGAHSSRDGEDYRKILQEVIDKTVKGGK